jgi:hypothetical protein
VLTRTSTKRVADRNGLLYALPQGLPPLTWIGGESAILLEPARTNLCIRSEEFETWTNTDTCNVSSNAIAAPDGATTADLLTATLTTSRRERGATFTGNADKAFAIYLKAGTSTRTLLRLRDTTAAADRLFARVTWVAGVPSVSVSTGTGYTVESLASGWYRFLFTATGVVAANSNVCQVWPDDLLGTGTVYAWGAQAEDAVVPSSYIKTEGTTVTRNADSLYFPFTAPPQAMTVYVRGVERGTRLEPGAYIWQVSQSNNNPRVHLNRTVGTARMQFQTVSSAAAFSTVSAPTPAADPNVGDLVEFRSILSSNGNLNLGVSLNAGAESLGAPVTGTALESAWSGQRLWIGSSGAGSNGLFAFTHVAVAAGERSLDTMRALAGV